MLTLMSSPTPIQLCTPHHPYLDVIAIPSMRDNIIIADMNDEQVDQLCEDMHTGAFTVWGSQPWNEMCTAPCTQLIRFES